MLTVYNYILTKLLPLYCSLYRRLHVLECDGLEMFLTLHVGDQLGIRLAGLREAPGRPALAVLHQEAGPGSDQQAADVLSVVGRRLV